jgi:putative inorganic carbon (hco3(-)) transporter
MTLSVPPSSKPLAQVRRAFGLLASLEIWVVGGMAAASFLIESLLPWAVLTAAVFWPVRWLAFGRLTVRTPADWGVLLLALMVPVTLWATALPELTHPQVYRLGLGFGLFYAVANWTVTESRLRWLAMGLLATGVGLAAAAAVGVEWGASKLRFLPDFFSERFPLLLANTIHPNVMAGTLVLLLPVSLALALFIGRGRLSSPVHPQANLGNAAAHPGSSARRSPGDLGGLLGDRGWQWALWLAAVLSAACMVFILVFTRSRGGWLAAGVVLALLPLLRWRWGWALLLAVVLAAGGGVYYLGPQPILEILSSNDAIGGLEGRVEIWSRAIYMIQDFPFTGIGMGSFMQVADLLYPFFLAAPGKIEHAHNLFLQVAVDVGLPGLLGWLAVLLTVAFTAWRVYRWGMASGNLWAAGLGAGVLLSQLAMLLHGQVDAVVWGMVRPVPLVWLVWGVAIAAGNLYLRPGEHSVDPILVVSPAPDIIEITPEAGNAG